MFSKSREAMLRPMSEQKDLSIFRDIQARVGDAYRIEEELLEGGIGMVYRATQVSVDRDVVIKVLRDDAEVRDNPYIYEGFVREMQVLQEVSNDPFILTIFDALPDTTANDSDTLYGIVIEYADNGSLSSEMVDYRQKDTLPTAGDVTDIGFHIARGLAALHEHGILHLDIKPENVLLFDTNEGREPVRAKITDFNIAYIDPKYYEQKGGTPDTPLVVSNADIEATHRDIALGTYSYMSPEARNRDTLGIEADWYSLGLVLFEMRTGESAGAYNVTLGGDEGMSVDERLAKEVYHDIDAVIIALTRPQAKDRQSVTLADGNTYQFKTTRELAALLVHILVTSGERNMQPPYTYV